MRIDRDGFDQATTPGSAPDADVDPWAPHDPGDVLVAVLDGQVVGYEVEGVLRGEFVIDGTEVDDVLMARRLG